MPHDGKIHRDDGHGEHGCDKDLSRQHMAGGTFAERHRSGPGQQPPAPSANMHNQYGRIGHWLFLEIYTWTGAPVFHRTALKCRSNTWGFWMVSDEEDRAFSADRRKRVLDAKSGNLLAGVQIFRVETCRAAF